MEALKRLIEAIRAFLLREEEPVRKAPSSEVAEHITSYRVIRNALLVR